MASSTIIPITFVDIETLVYLSRKVFRDAFEHLNTPGNMSAYMDRAFNPQQLLSELVNPLSEFYFILSEGKVAGYLKINRGNAQSDIGDPDSLEIERIYIEQSYQGNGLGADLLAKAKQRAAELNLNFLWLGVWEKNGDAIRFYKRHGFEAFGDHAFTMGDEIQTDVLMRCETIKR